MKIKWHLRPGVGYYTDVVNGLKGYVERDACGDNAWVGDACTRSDDGLEITIACDGYRTMREAKAAVEKALRKEARRG